MLACPKCRNCDEFSVIECVWQHTRIQCYSNGDYDFIDTSFQSLEEWGEITCVACGYVGEEEELRQTYYAAHGLDELGLPIPYTLVDASVS